MFYETNENKHGLLHDPFKSCVVPRCIGWISSISEDGVVNLAPYSFFNAIATNPHMVMFGTGGRHPHGVKDSITNIEETGEFGTLILMGYDWDDKEAWVHSMELFARELMPALNVNIL